MSSKISLLTDGVTAAATDRLPVARAGANVYVTPAYIKDYILRLANAFSVNGAASTPPMSLTGTWFTGGTATTTKPQHLIEPTGTTSTAWSTNGTGLGINAASGFTGNLLDAQLNGVSKLSISSAGAVVAGGFIQTPSVGLSYLGAGHVNLPNSGLVAWSSTGAISGTPDLYLYRDAANVLAQRNGTNAQTSRVYNTYTDASNYEAFQTLWSANTVYVQTISAGAGSARDMVITPKGNLYLGAGGVSNDWKIDGVNKHFLATTDNNNDIGASGANRPRNLYLAGTATIGGNVTVTAGSFIVNGSGKVFGYGTGAGGSVTQATSRTTGVAISNGCGAITLFTAAGSATPASFTVTNSQVAATDTIILGVKSASNKYVAIVTAVGSGSFEITFWSASGTASDAPVINFTVIKAVTA